jgi:thiol-disulfide isomerase/thioredoxin
MLYALAILQAKAEDNYGRVTVFDDSADAAQQGRQARDELEKSKNAAVLGGAGAKLQQQLYSLEQARRTTPVPDIAELAEKYLQRALDLEPENSSWKSNLSMLYMFRGGHTSDKAAALRWHEKAAEVADANNKISALQTLATAQLNAGEYTKAAESARELLSVAASRTGSWDYGNAIHRGNILLGRIALHQGDNAEAARRLLVAGGTKGSPQLNSFGPDWVLARELMAHGDRDTVLAYIDLCRKFWTMGAKRLDTWAAVIREGGVPSFSERPVLPKSDLLGKPAPALRLPKLKGGEVSLNQFKGKIVLLDFWATWCGPCRAEMPSFEKLHRELSGGDVVILAVDVGEAEVLVADYIGKEKLTFPVALAEGTDVPSRYGVDAYPTLVAVDRNGNVADYVIGSRSESELRNVIEAARRGVMPAAAPVQTTPVSRGLPAPKQLSPAPAALFDHYPRVTTLVWAEVPGASGYVVEWDYKDAKGWADSRPSYVVATMKVTDPVATIEFVGSQPGRWRVMALDSAGNSGEASPWREFRYTR